MSYRLVSPYIRWGTNYANAAYFGFPVDNGTSWSEPGSESEFFQYISGTEDAWIPRTDQVLEGDLRYIPGSDTLFYPRCTGWDFNAATPGVRQMLEWVKNKNLFAWHPDGRNLVRLPLLNSAGAVSLGGLGGWALFQSAGGLTSVTNAYDAGVGAWKVGATNPTGGSIAIGITQFLPVIAGEQVQLSVDYETSSLAGGANGIIQINLQDGVGAFLGTVCFASGLTAGTFTRPATSRDTTLANSASALVALTLSLPAGASGNIWFKNAMLRRDGGTSTFIDNPSIDAYWVDPTVVPTWETDGQRKLHVKIRDQALGFEGY